MTKVVLIRGEKRLNKENLLQVGLMLLYPKKELKKLKMAVKN